MGEERWDPQKTTELGPEPGSSTDGGSTDRPRRSPRQSLRRRNGTAAGPLADEAYIARVRTDLDESQTPTPPQGSLPHTTELTLTDEEPPAREAGSEPSGEGEPEETSASLWGEWLRENRAPALILGLMMVLAVVGVGALVGLVPGGGSGAEPEGVRDGEAPPEAGEAQTREGAAQALQAATEAGELRVDREEATVTVSIAPDGGTHAGELDDGEQQVVLQSDENSTEASFTRTFTEGERAGWSAYIDDDSRENLMLKANQSTDPGPAALDGRVPFLRGNYIAKARDGSFSATGDYTDTLMAGGTVLRTYEETYLASATGPTEPRQREFSVRFEFSGDPAMVPTLIGYEMPEETDLPGEGGR